MVLDSNDWWLKYLESCNNGVCPYFRLMTTKCSIELWWIVLFPVTFTKLWVEIQWDWTSGHPACPCVQQLFVYQDSLQLIHQMIVQDELQSHLNFQMSLLVTWRSKHAYHMKPTVLSRSEESISHLSRMIPLVAPWKSWLVTVSCPVMCHQGCSICSW